MMADDGMVTLGDFRRLPGEFQYITMVPQWGFLTFLTEQAAAHPTFALHHGVEATGLIVENGNVRGVRYRGPDGPGELRAELTVACDGRGSAVRTAAGLEPIEYGVPLDVLWFRLPKEPGDPPNSFARLAPGRLFPMIDRRTYWQGAYTMPEGAFADLRHAGIDALRADLARWLPFPADRIQAAIRGWDDVGFLHVRVNRLRRWHRPGLLCIGDAAHAMSPIAGVGINLAIQDAVAAANLLTAPLLDRRLTERDLAEVQRRRSMPTRLTQQIQLLVQRRMISGSGDPGAPATLPWALRLLSAFPPLLRLFSRFMAIGVRNEHVAAAPVRTTVEAIAAPKSTAGIR